jgi:hypothetical protein
MPAPTAPILQVTDDQNGTTATAVVSGADALTVNRVYVQHVNSLRNPLLMATILGNGSATITPGSQGEWQSFVTSSTP